MPNCVNLLLKGRARIVREEITRCAQKIAESPQLKVDVKVGSGGYAWSSATLH